METEYYENRFTGELMTVRFEEYRPNPNQWDKITKERYEELKTKLIKG